jgi:hypothetical protein
MGNYYRGHFKYEPKKNYSAEIGGGLYLPIGKHLVLEAYSLYINTRLQRSSFHVIPSLFSEHVGAASRSINLKYIGNSNRFDIGYLFFDDNNISHCIGLGVKLSRIQYDFFTMIDTSICITENRMRLFHTRSTQRCPLVFSILWPTPEPTG